MKRFILFFFLSLTLSCSNLKKVDSIIYNAKIYTVDSVFSQKQAMAFHDGKILAVGTTKEILAKYESDKIVDLQQKYVYPGFIDPHCHFYGYGLSLKWADLKGTKSFDEIIDIIKKHQKNASSVWLLGRGWDQNDWETKTFPTNEKLNELFPETPVYLVRIDGHAALVNAKALEIAGFDASTKIEGGQLKKKNEKLTGILIDKAKDVLFDSIPEETREQKAEALIQAAQNCFAVGLTTIADAGLRKGTIELIDSLQKAGQLNMRIYAMLESSDPESLHLAENGIYKTDHLHVQAIKMYADGALGSRGALLLEDYADDPGNKGILVNTQAYYDKICELAYANNFQVCTHAIGDGANRIVLNTYAKFLDEENDLRWRIEHAQVIHPDDFDLFGKYNIVPSMQSTHATSDMCWAEDRLGPERIKNAYALKKLMQQNGWIPNGSDFPVEHINPLYGFYAAIARKDQEGYPDDGFQMENALSRKEALRAMTIWAAKSCFEENEKGSIEPGKFADFVVLEEDLMQVDAQKIPEIQIVSTYIDGKKVH